MFFQEFSYWIWNWNFKLCSSRLIWVLFVFFSMLFLFLNFFYVYLFISLFKYFSLWLSDPSCLLIQKSVWLVFIFSLLSLMVLTLVVVFRMSVIFLSLSYNTCWNTVISTVECTFTCFKNFLCLLVSSEFFFITHIEVTIIILILSLLEISIFGRVFCWGVGLSEWLLKTVCKFLVYYV